MKLKFSYLFSIVLLIGTAGAAFAQEGSQGPEELPPNADTNTRDDKPLIYEPEGKSSVNQSVTPVLSNSSNNVPAAKPKPKTEAAKSSNTKPEDDALSFNFLLHIIQRFKSSDLVGQ